MQTAGGELGGLPETVLGSSPRAWTCLPPAEKELLRDAAVMGGVVWSDGCGPSPSRTARRSTTCFAPWAARSSCAAIDGRPSWARRSTPSSHRRP